MKSEVFVNNIIIFYYNVILHKCYITYIILTVICTTGNLKHVHIIRSIDHKNVIIEKRESQGTLFKELLNFSYMNQFQLQNITYIN